MDIQEWLARLLAHPPADALDWETYCITMAEPTWKALWQDIEASQAYEDGLEVGLRLLQATQQHREKLTPRAHGSNQMRLYRSILSMLDKADRWDAYLVAWDTILAQTTLCQPMRGDATDDDPRLAALVRRPDGGLGVGRLPYGAARPKTIAVHFLHTRLGRKAVIERRLAQDPNGKRPSGRHPEEGGALTAKEIESRLIQAGCLPEERTAR